ncbi:MAG: polyprenyl synthetase family protein [Candidatus Competibacterales bacterium]
MGDGIASAVGRSALQVDFATPGQHVIVADSDNPTSPSLAESSNTGPGRYWRWAEAQLPAVNGLLDGIAQVAEPLATGVNYHLAGRGRQWRARLALAVARCWGATEGTTAIAAACELLHNASLVHDDLQDRDTTRRDREAVWYRFGPEYAINLGDYLIVQSFALVAAADIPAARRLAVTQAFSRAASTAITGQALDLEGELIDDPRGAWHHYCTTARYKSGSLFALPAESVLRSAGAPDTLCQRVSDLLVDFGLLYQLLDDTADVLDQKPGRAAGSDLRQRRLTAPVVCHLTDPRVPVAQANALRAFLQTDPAADDDPHLPDHWRRILADGPGVATCRASAKTLKGELFAAIRQLPTPLRDCLNTGLEAALGASGLWVGVTSVGEPTP